MDWIPSQMEIRTVPLHALTSEQTTQIIELCSEVFRLDYAFYMDLDLPRVHVLGYAGERLVAHALWLTRRLRVGAGPWLEAAYVEGVATHADFRRQGYGSAVMRRLQGEISGFDLGALSPSQAGWYERLGWERWQGPLFIIKDDVAEATADECVLIYRTPKTGALDRTAPLTGEWRPFELW
jgi:aminoglycoside 2'-N-acetyltransferase I